MRNPLSKSRQLTTPPGLSGIALQLVMYMLLPEDLARANMVCKTWNEDLKPKPPETTQDTTEEASTPSEQAPMQLQYSTNDSGFVWKQAASNLEPRVVQVLDEDIARGKPVDYHRLAVGLTCNRKRKKPEKPEPTFRIEDLVVVVEIKREVLTMDESGQEVTTIESLGAFSCDDCTKLLDGREGIDFEVPQQRAFTIEARNCVHGDDPASAAFREVWRMDQEDSEEFWRNSFLSPMRIAAIRAVDEENRMFASVFLVRRNDWRSFCLSESGFICSEDLILSYDTPGITEVFPTERTETLASSVFVRNEAGHVAREVMETYGLRFRTHLSFKSTLTYGSDAEPAALRKIREAESYSALNWTDEDLGEFQSIPKFQFRLSSVSFGFDGSRPGRQDIDRNDLLLILEGLDWQ